jgi:hypothetical protein
MDSRESVNEVKAKSPDLFEDDRYRSLAYDVGAYTLLFGNLEAILSYYIGSLVHDPAAAMYKHAERLQYVDRAGLFCDLVIGRFPEYKEVVSQLKRDLKKIAEERNIIVHNGIKVQGDKLVLQTLGGKPIDAASLKALIVKLQELSDRVATVWMTLTYKEAGWSTH